MRSAMDAAHERATQARSTMLLRPSASAPHLHFQKVASPPARQQREPWRQGGGTAAKEPRAPPPLPSKGPPTKDELARERRSIMLHAFSYNAFEDYNNVPPPVHSSFDYRPKRVPIHATGALHPQTSRYLSHSHPSDVDVGATMWEPASPTTSPRPARPMKRDLNAIEQSALHGRMVALHVANEEATRSGVPWATDKTLRMHAAAKGTSGAAHEVLVSTSPHRADFGSAALAELMDEGVEAVRRRVIEALESAVKARRDSERSEATVLHSLRAMPHLDEDSKALALQLLMRCHRAGERLRQAMYHLEMETAQAQSVYAGDRRVLATQLVAQREAVATTLTRELADAENGRSDSRRSIASLEQQLKHLERGRHENEGAFDARVRELEHRLDVAETKLAAEVETRAAAAVAFASSIQTLREENQGLRDTLSTTRQRAEAEQTTLAAQVASLEAEASEHRADTERRAMEAMRQRRDDEEAYQAQLAEARKIADHRQTALERAREASDLEYARLNSALTRKIKATEMTKEMEVKKLQHKIERLEALLTVARRQKAH